MILALILVPVLAGLAAFGARGWALRRALWLGTAVVHAVLTAWCWGHPPASMAGGWLVLDALGLLFLSIASVLFLAAAVYGIGYLGRERRHPRADVEEGFLFTNAPEAVFVGCLLLFLGAMTLVTASHHLGLLWIGVEATTLASAPLIYFHRHHRSLEATWKYLLICSVGIALALLGNFFLGVAASTGGDGALPLVMERLMGGAGELQAPWLKAAFILSLVGYGTKMGLAPLHTWLPDAHSEAPSVISALLSGALLNCAFLGILRMEQVCVAAGMGSFARELLVLMGLVSMGVAAVFILGQTDYKRLLAYSSVEHVGILSLGVGLGGAGVFGAMFHAVNHSLTKAMLFLVAGHVLALYETKMVAQVRGLTRVAPVTGVLWLAGFFAISGVPPFGTFLSEFTILKAAFDGHRDVVGVIYLACLALIFMGMATAFLGMAQGRPPQRLGVAPVTGRTWMLAPCVVLAMAVLWLGCHLPAPVENLLRAAARIAGGA